MPGKRSFKRALFLLFSKMPFLLRRWSIKKKLHVSLLSLVCILGLNAVLTSFEVARLKEHGMNLSYLIYLDLLGIFVGCLFIWIISKSVIRPMRRMVKQIETKTFLDHFNTYGHDEIGELARAVSFMKKNHSSTGGVLEEKNKLIEAILDHSVESIFIFNAKGEISSYSRSFKERFGFSEEDLDEAGLDLIIPNVELQKIAEQFSGEAPLKYFYTKELLAKKQNHKVFKIECSICPISNQNEECYVGIIRNLQKANRFKNFIRKYTTRN